MPCSYISTSFNFNLVKTQFSLNSTLYFNFNCVFIIKFIFIFNIPLGKTGVFRKSQIPFECMCACGFITLFYFLLVVYYIYYSKL